VGGFARSITTIVKTPLVCSKTTSITSLNRTIYSITMESMSTTKTVGLVKKRSGDSKTKRVLAFSADENLRSLYVNPHGGTI
jgi:hypothetical protein